MPQLTKGQNAPLPGADIIVDVQLTAPADVSALLVKADGKVRNDADFVFFNQPSGPGVTLQGGRLYLTTGQVPADIDSIRVVATLDDPSRPFGQFAPPVVRVSDPGGAPVHEYVVDGLSTESVVITLDIYRRGDQWKVRAVGQGYAGGFADLVRDHGVSVDDAPAPPPPAPAPAPAAPQYNQPPPYTPAPQYNQPPAYSPAPAAPQYDQAPPPPYGQPAAAQGPISLSKDRPVSLVKGQKVSLRKEGGVALTQVMMGLGWDPVAKRGMFGKARAGDIDLDASVLLFSQGQCVDIISFRQLRARDGSIIHSGDNLTGDGDGDDETIAVNLPALPAHVDNLVFIVTSYRGQTFQEVENAYCRLIDLTTGAELARYWLTGGMPVTGVTMAVISRAAGEWQLRAIGDGFNATDPQKSAPYVMAHLG